MCRSHPGAPMEFSPHCLTESKRLNVVVANVYNWMIRPAKGVLRAVWLPLFR